MNVYVPDPSNETIEERDNVTSLKPDFFKKLYKAIAEEDINILIKHVILNPHQSSPNGSKIDTAIANLAASIIKKLEKRIPEATETLAKTIESAIDDALDQEQQAIAALLPKDIKELKLATSFTQTTNASTDLTTIRQDIRLATAIIASEIEQYKQPNQILVFDPAILSHS